MVALSVGVGIENGGVGAILDDGVGGDVGIVVGGVGEARTHTTWYSSDERF